MRTRTPAGASARPAARKRASASVKSRPRKKPASPGSRPRTNAAHDKPPRKKPGAPRRKTASRKRAPLSITRTPPPRTADPFARRTGRRRNYYTAEFLAEAQRRVETTTQSTTSIALDLGTHQSNLARLIRRHGWVRPEGSSRVRGLAPAMRLAMQADALVSASAHSRASGNPASDTPTPEGVALGPRWSLSSGGPEARPGGGDERSETPAALDSTAIDRLEAAVLDELATVETMRASLRAEPRRPIDAERTARTLSVLTETIAKLRRLRLAAQPQSGSADHDDDIPDIDAFRLDLARRIEAFVASQPDDECVEPPAAVAVEPAEP